MTSYRYRRDLETAEQRRTYTYTIEEVTEHDMRLPGLWQGPTTTELEEMEYTIVKRMEKIGIAAVYNEIQANTAILRCIWSQWDERDWDWDILRADLAAWRTTVVRNISFFTNLRRHYGCKGKQDLTETLEYIELYKQCTYDDSVDVVPLRIRGSGPIPITILESSPKQWPETQRDSRRDERMVYAECRKRYGDTLTELARLYLTYPLISNEQEEKVIAPIYRERIQEREDELFETVFKEEGMQTSSVVWSIALYSLLKGGKPQTLGEPTVEIANRSGTVKYKIPHIRITSAAEDYVYIGREELKAISAVILRNIKDAFSALKAKEPQNAANPFIPRLTKAQEMQERVRTLVNSPEWIALPGEVRKRILYGEDYKERLKGFTTPYWESPYEAERKREKRAQEQAAAQERRSTQNEPPATHPSCRDNTLQETDVILDHRNRGEPHTLTGGESTLLQEHHLESEATPPPPVTQSANWATEPTFDLREAQREAAQTGHQDLAQRGSEQRTERRTRRQTHEERTADRRKRRDWEPDWRRREETYRERTREATNPNLESRHEETQRRPWQDFERQHTRTPTNTRTETVSISTQTQGDPRETGYEPRNAIDNDIRYWMSDTDSERTHREEPSETDAERPGEREEEHRRAEGNNPGTPHEEPSDSESGNPEDNPEEPDITDFNNFEAQLRIALREDNVNIAKRQLAHLTRRHRHSEQLEARGDMSLSWILYCIRGKAWPQPRKYTCIVRGCDTQTSSEGMMRKHLRGKHNFDTNQTTDVLDLELEYLLNKRIITHCTLPNGSTPQEINFRNRIRNEIRCHACPYQTDHDYNLTAHRNKHSKFVAEIDTIGLFWATLRLKTQDLERIPTLQELLGHKESMVRCRRCGLKTDQGLNNMKTHLTRKHPGATMQQDADPVVVTHMLHDEYQEQHTEEEEEETVIEAPQRWTKEEVEPQITINEEALAGVHITATNIDKAYREHNTAVLSSILLLAARTEGNCYRDAIELMKRVKLHSDPATQVPINLNDDITEALYKIPAQEWPLMINKHQCCHCNSVFALPTHWRQHMLEHTLGYSEASEAKDFIRKHMEPTKYCATTTDGQVLTATKGIYRCEVPGCGFCTTELRELDKHRQKQTANEQHAAMWAQQSKYGAFFGQLKYMIARDGHVPSVREFLGQTRQRITLCVTCFAIIGRTEEAVREHYQKHNHAHTALQATQATLKEVPLDYEDPQRNYTEWNGDRIRLSAAINVMWSAARQEAPARQQTPEERAALEAATVDALMRNHMQRQAQELDEEEESSTEEQNAAPTRQTAAPQQPREAPETPPETEHQPPRAAAQEPMREATAQRRQTLVREQPRTVVNEPPRAPAQEHPRTAAREPPQIQTHGQPNATTRGRSEPVNRQTLPQARQRNALEPETPAETGTEQERDARRKYQKARTWLLDGIERERIGIRMPRLNRAERKLVQDGLKDLFADELTPLLEDYIPSSSDPAEWEAFQGAIYQCQHLMRVHILSKLGKPLTQMMLSRKKPFVNDYTKSLERKEAKSRRLLNVTKDIEELTLAVQNAEERKTQQLVQKVSMAIHELPKREREKWWGTSDIPTILEEIERQVGNEEAYGEWLESTIIAYTTKIQECRNSKKTIDKIREEYSDNAKKYVHNILWETAKPECQIEMEEMRQYLKTMFEPEEKEEWNETFNTISTFQEEDLEDIQEHINKHLDQAIITRSWLSAPGPDGIDYTLYKLGGNKAREWLQKLFGAILKAQQMPAPLMKSRTIFAHKKGDPNLKENWRPLTISNASYRILMVALNNALQDLNRRKPLINSNQKGFMNGVNGCIENALTVSELFYHAERKQKSLYVMALDFKNAFGSVNHEYIEEVLTRKQMPEALRKLIMNTYQGATTRIQQQGQTSEEVVIKGGTKQGCPLSPFLFNLCLDPLINDIDKLASDVGYQIGDDYFAIQAYADDILLISKNAEGIQAMIQRVEQFEKMSGMRLAPQKCELHVYGMSAQRTRYYEDDLYIHGSLIHCSGKEGTIRYLGAPIAASKSIKMKSNRMSEAEFYDKLHKITRSNLAIVQKIHAIKTFLLPKLEYACATSIYAVKTLERMDKHVRKEVSKMIGGTLPIGAIHSSTKDGGLGIPSLQQKQDVAVVRTFLALLKSPDSRIKRLIKKSLKDERNRRGIPEADKQRFFNWQAETLDGTSGTNSITARCFRATQRLQIGITKGDNHGLIITDKDKEEHEITTRKHTSTLVLHEVRRKWQEEMNQPTMHKHSYQSLKNSPLSNAFITRVKKPPDDSFVRFAIGARNNTLATQEMQECMTRHEHRPCRYCHKAVNGSLCHILNGCHHNNRLIIERHDNITDLLAEAMVKDDTALVIKNSTVKEIALDRNKTDKPDLQLWNRDRTHVTLVEVNCPYAQTWEGVDTLEEKYLHKWQKYQPLLQEIQSHNVGVTYIVVVVSSLGALHATSVKQIHQYFNDKKQSDKLLRTISSKALAGSAKIWWQLVHEPGNEGRHPARRTDEGGAEEETAEEEPTAETAEIETPTEEEPAELDENDRNSRLAIERLMAPIEDRE